MSTPILTAERLRELLHYDSETGVWTWLKRTSNRVKIGAHAGCVNTLGYRVIMVDGRLYLAHRLAWLYMTGEWPTHLVHHDDRCPGNDRWSNLRGSTHSQNHANSKRYSNNTTGFKGVTYNKNRRKFQAQIQYKNKNINLGLFDDPAEASSIYLMKAAELFGEFARAE